MSVKTERYPELDSIRGLAALVVLTFHAFNVLMLWDYVSPLIGRSPLRIIWSGHQAVILFFVLSGFVLSIPLMGKRANYKVYLIKRICRIWIPYIVAVMLALCMRIVFGQGEVAGVWGVELTFSNIFNHVILLGTFDQSTINPVVWSLVHEMRISIIFPFLFLMIERFNWKVNLGVAINLSIIGVVLNLVFLDSIDVLTSYFITIHYVSFFIIGSLLAKNRSNIVKFFNSKSKTFRITVICLGILFFSYSNSLDGNLLLKYGSDWFAAIGGGIIIISALSVNRFSKMLLLKPVLFIGKISYSLYLYHLFVILTVFTIFSNILSVWVILLISVCVSFLLSSISYYFVEKPGVSFGKYLTGDSIRRGNRVFRLQKD